MRLVLALIWNTVVAVCASAQSYPMLHDVTDIPVGDVLNIRTAPEPDALILGVLARGQTGVEVIATDPSGTWGKVNAGEASGWVSLRHLTPQPGAGSEEIMAKLNCAGTEPFWTLTLIQGQASAFSTPEASRDLSGTGFLTRARGRVDRFYTGFGDGSSAIVRREQCDDGMSDRAYGLDIDLLTVDPTLGGPVMLSGCCSIAQN